jgi:hypothetical protein
MDSEEHRSLRWRTKEIQQGLWKKYDSAEGFIANFGEQGDRSSIDRTKPSDIDTNCAFFDNSYQHVLGPFGSSSPGMTNGGKSIEICDLSDRRIEGLIFFGRTKELKWIS